MSRAKRTDPELWEKVKGDLRSSDKGGEPGEWSARKAQLAVQEYKKRGGDYEGQQSSENSLKKWTKEDWGTRSGRPSSKTGERYLPKAAREELTDDEYERTSAKKRRDTAAGKQHSPQPQDVAAKAAKHRINGSAEADPGDDDETGGASKKDLLARARELEIERRSQLSKDELEFAIKQEEDRRRRRDQVSKDDLMEAAAMLGVERRYSKNKGELRLAIAEALRSDAGGERTKEELKDLARTFGVPGHSSMAKAELREAVQRAAI